MGRAPFRRWHSQTFIAGLTSEGLIAPWIIPGAMDGDAFDTYIATQLAPALGPVVILDRLSTPRSPRASAALKARGCWFLFLPAYSPDLNPIEMAFGPTQGASAPPGGPKLRAHPGGAGRPLSPLHPHRGRELLPSRRIRVRLKANRFNTNGRWR